MTQTLEDQNPNPNPKGRTVSISFGFYEGDDGKRATISYCVASIGRSIFDGQTRLHLHTESLDDLFGCMSLEEATHVATQKLTSGDYGAGNYIVVPVITVYD